MPAHIALGLAAAIAANAAIRTTQIEIPDSSRQLAIHCVEPSRPSRAGVLFVHGATFPTRLASGYEFSPNDSWLAFVAAEGYLPAVSTLSASALPADRPRCSKLLTAPRPYCVRRKPPSRSRLRSATCVASVDWQTFISSLTRGALCRLLHSRPRIPQRFVRSRCSGQSFPCQERPSRPRSAQRGTR